MNKEEFIRIIKSKHRAPYLFLGSGFTKHYLPTPTWEELLSQFTSRHMNEIYTKMGRDLPKVASFIAEEVNNTFWKRINDDPQCVEKQYVDRISQSRDSLRIKISEKLKALGISYRTNDEINYLSKLHIDGIITTNWDDFAEVVFPKFKKYVGQSELLFSSTTNIGEIFKIHGCIHQPNTMVLTKEDYENFTQRNAYLAAKLITIFLEHPIFFIGYSLEDPNIQEILESIVDCFKGNESLSSKLQNNLIFVEWVPEHIADIRIERLSKMMRNGVMLPCIKIIAHDFMPIYECMSYFERGIPTHLLRVYKEQFYDIIYDEQPEKQIYVLPESKVDGNNSVDFVCGFGAISKYKEIGYSSIDRQMIFRDIIDEQNYDAYRILKKSFPSVRNGNVNYLPYYKYLNSLGINSVEQCRDFDEQIFRELKKQTNFQSYKFANEEKQLSLHQVIERYKNDDVWKAFALIPYLHIEESDYGALREFIRGHFEKYISDKRSSTFFRKLICYFDWLLYGQWYA